MKIFKNWIRLFFVSFLVSIISISLFNFFIDSASVFGNKSYLSKAAEDLVSGKMIAGLSNYDERLFQLLIIKKNKRRVDTIVLGSSRAMVIRKKFVVNKDKVFLNHSVSGASLEDYIAIVDLYQTLKNYIPKHIVIGVDPWIFNKFNGQSRWRTLKDNYFNLLSKIMDKSIDNKSSINGTKWKQLINYEYTVANIFSLKKNFNRNPYYITPSVDIEDSVKGLDDSLYYPLSQRTPDVKVVEKLAHQFAQKGQVYSIENFNELSNIEEFEKFILYLKEKGIKITFVLFPYNPISYKLLVKNENYAIIQDVEAYLNKFSKDNDIELLSSYNPDKYNFKNRDFKDGMHGLESVSETIFKEYKRK